MKYGITTVLATILMAAIFAQDSIRGGNALVTILDEQGQPITLTKCVVVAQNFPQPLAAGVSVQYRDTFLTDANGTFTITNATPSEYEVSALGNNFTPFYFIMPSTNGTVAVQNTLVYPNVPNLGSNYVTFAEGDLRYAAGGGSSGPNLWTSSGSAIYPSGITGTNSGWAAAGTTLYPQ